MGASVDSSNTASGASEVAILEESFQPLASRLANTAQVLTAWAQALRNSSKAAVRGRLEAAASKIEQAVGALTDSGSAAPNTAAALPRATSSAGALGLRGRSEMISLVEFVGFLSSLNRDGVLQVQCGAEEFVLQIEQSTLVFATGNNPAGLGLGELLVANEALSARGLESARAQKQPHELIGETLTRLGMIDQRALHTALQQQITQMFCRMHLVGTGFDFRFEEGTRVFLTADIRLNIAHLLLESARLKDEGETVDESASVASQVADALDFDAPCQQARPRRPPSTREPTPPSGRPASADVGITVGTMVSKPKETDLASYRASVEQTIESGTLVLPSLPDSTGQLLAMCWQEDVDSARLADRVSSDQALCAHILRVANSAAYSPVNTISSVQLAITRLGVGKIREIALALTLEQDVFQLPGWQDMVRGLWRTAAITAGFATRLGARALGSRARGSLLGLLQDIGKPIVLGVIHDLGSKRGEHLSRDGATVIVDEFHGKAGVCLARKWDLPDWLCTVIEHHHDCEQAGDQRLEATVANVAYELALWIQGQAHEDPASLVALPAWTELGLGAEDLQRFEDEREKILEMAQAYS